MFDDANAHARAEAGKWPYAWVSGVDYPLSSERATVTGHLVLKDPQAKGAKMSDILVGLSAPAYTAQIPARTVQPAAPRVRPRGCRRWRCSSRGEPAPAPLRSAYDHPGLGAQDRLADRREALRVLGARRCQRQLQVDRRASREPTRCMPWLPECWANWTRPM